MKLDLVTSLILMAAIISIGAVGLSAFAIWLYHRDGGTRSTKTILLNAATTYFAWLIPIWRWIKR